MKPIWKGSLFLEEFLSKQLRPAALLLLHAPLSQTICHQTEPGATSSPQKTKSLYSLILLLPEQPSRLSCSLLASRQSQALTHPYTESTRPKETSFCWLPKITFSFTNGIASQINMSPNCQKPSPLASSLLSTTWLLMAPTSSGSRKASATTTSSGTVETTIILKENKLS